MNCRAAMPLLEPFADGELSPDRVVEVEQHLEECERCVERVRLCRAMRMSLKRAGQAEPSAAFRSRLSSAIVAEHQREWEARVLEREVEHSRMLSWRTILPVAAAAALTLVWAASTNNEPSLHNKSTSAQLASENVDELLEELIQHHMSSRPEVTSPTLVPTELGPEVGVPVSIPSFSQYGGHWEGGSVAPLHHMRAASLRYKLAGHRVTVYIYDSNRVQIEERLQRRLVGDEPVYVGTRNGFSIGATDHHGVGYAVASDLKEPETAELVAALH